MSAVMISDPLFWAVAIPAIFIDGISKGGFGGGLGVVAVPIMAVAINPVQAAAIMLPILCIMDWLNIWAYRGRWEVREARLLILSGILGIAIGTFTFRWLNEDAVRVLLGVLSLGFTLNWAWKQWHRIGGERQPYNVRKGMLWGSLTGFTSFVAHAGGPPANVYLLPRQLDKTTYQATTALLFAVTNMIKLIPYAWLGQLSVGNLSTSAALIPIGLLGIQAGVWAHHHLPDRWFYISLYVLLGVLGVKLLWGGVGALL
ncbi:sulfite exporter TauE/SafE family protein [Pokkaliibacter plantistimulans]|nr:sulfite exporter TauE/SafE family protein [Pokkaliibacter plantistimulans]